MFQVIQQFFLHFRIDRALRIGAAALFFARRNARQQGNALVDRFHRVNGECAVPARLHDVLAQHQVFHVRLGNDDPLFAGQTAHDASVEKAFDFFVHAADRLNLSELVDRPRHRQRLLNRQAGQRGKHGVQFGGGSGIAVDLAVRLLEHQGGGHRQRGVLRVFRRQERRQNQYAFRVNGTAQFDFALDIQHVALADARQAGDAAGTSERRLTVFVHRQPVDLPDNRTVRVNHDCAAADLLHHALLQAIRALFAPLDRRVDVRAVDNVRLVRHRAIIRLAHHVADGRNVRG